MKKILFLTIAMLFGIFSAVYADNYQSLSIISNINGQSNYTNNNNQDNNGLSMSVTDYVSTTNSTNLTAKFYYYIPSRLINATEPYPLIVTVPGMDCDGRDAVYEELKNLADTKGYAILAPTFKHNENDFNQQKSYQYPAAWSGAALNNMLDRAKSNGLNYSKLYLVGFSAGGQFVSRYSLLYPDRVAACAILSSGARVKPTLKTNVKYFIGIGTGDIDYRKENAEIFYRAALNLGIPVVYQKYNMDHTTSSAEINDVVNFIENVRAGLI